MRVLQRGGQHGGVWLADNMRQSSEHGSPGRTGAGATTQWRHRRSTSHRLMRWPCYERRNSPSHISSIGTIAGLCPTAGARAAQSKSARWHSLATLPASCLCCGVPPPSVKQWLCLRLGCSVCTLALGYCPLVCPATVRVLRRLPAIHESPRLQFCADLSPVYFVLCCGPAVRRARAPVGPHAVPPFRRSTAHNLHARIAFGTR